MKTFSFSVTYHYEDSGEVQAESYEDAQREIEEMAYPVQAGRFSDSWSWVQFHDLEEIADDGEDDEDA